jgi:tetratricopeptide (TPR) repeat protein
MIASVRKDSNTAETAEIFKNIGKTYFSLGEYDKALEAFYKALDEYKKINNHKGEAIILEQIGLSYSKLAKEKEAIDSLNKALQINIEVGNTTAQAKTLNELGKIYQKLGKPEKALECFNKAVSLLEEKISPPQPLPQTNLTTPIGWVSCVNPTYNTTILLLQ